MTAPHVRFDYADINEPWSFGAGQQFDLIVFSLVLEHVENLGFVFEQAQQKLRPGGVVYVGELHPSKQYLGSQARFDTPAGRVEVPVFQHHVGEFFQQATAAGLHLLDLREWFDEDAPTGPPRLLTLLLQKLQKVS